MPPVGCAHHRDTGFSLVETVVATSLLAVSLVAMAELFATATRSNVTARNGTMTAILAAQKMEQLRGSAWVGLAALSPSPAGSLQRNVNGYVDYLDALGSPLGGGSSPPIGTVYIRRWSIEPLPTSPHHTLVLQVLVTRRVGLGAAGSIARQPGDARLLDVRTRTSP
jgi:type II secretory pathway pseudopilin PulG